MSEELINVVNFDGFVSHVGDSGEPSEVIVYVTHVVSDDSKTQGGNEIGVMQKSSVHRDHVNNNDIDYGIGINLCFFRTSRTLQQNLLFIFRIIINI